MQIVFDGCLTKEFFALLLRARDLRNDILGAGAIQ